MELISGGVCAAKGFKANGIHCGIRKNRTKRDLALIVSDVHGTAADYGKNVSHAFRRQKVSNIISKSYFHLRKPPLSFLLKRNAVIQTAAERFLENAK